MDLINDKIKEEDIRTSTNVSIIIWTSNEFATEETSNIIGSALSDINLYCLLTVLCEGLRMRVSSARDIISGYVLTTWRSRQRFCLLHDRDLVVTG